LLFVLAVMGFELGASIALFALVIFR
jgi:hypothetical protein